VNKTAEPAKKDRKAADAQLVIAFDESQGQ